VSTNLKNSFPNKTEEELKIIQDRFYRHFCDLTIEGVKIFSISFEDARKRLVVKNPDILKPYFESGKSIILVGGHYNNWEMLAVGIDSYIDHKSVAIYHRIENEFMNQKALASRSKYGLKMIARQEVRDFFKNDKSITATIFGADQSPTAAKKVYWMEFLNQDTPVMYGVEKFAKEQNQPVLYGHIQKVKRGHYEFVMELITDDPLNSPYGEITEAHTKRLEKEILKAPQYWLWSHKRWKRKRETNQQSVST